MSGFATARAIASCVEAGLSAKVIADQRVSLSNATKLIGRRKTRINIITLFVMFI